MLWLLLTIKLDFELFLGIYALCMRGDCDAL